VVGFVPKEMFFTKGVGKHREKLTSFELALRSELLPGNTWIQIGAAASITAAAYSALAFLFVLERSHRHALLKRRPMALGVAHG